MKANELRIGNYIYLKSKQKVYQIDSGHDIEEIDDAPKFFDAIPIPLTEEWLLKFGFSDISENCAGTTRNFKVFCKSYHVEKCTEQQTIFIYLGSLGWTFKRVGSPLYNHVHELQNLYRWLCGEELKFIV